MTQTVPIDELEDRVLEVLALLAQVARRESGVDPVVGAAAKTWILALAFADEEPEAFGRLVAARDRDLEPITSAVVCWINERDGAGEIGELLSSVRAGMDLIGLMDD